MANDNYVIEQEHAKAWENVIGHFGDPLRIMVMNWVVAHALNYFGGEAGSERIAKPHALIQNSLTALSNVADDIQTLIKEHENIDRLASKFPSLASTSLIDLGSGNGYLGGWLSTLGVTYTGVEASAELYQAARKDSRLKNATLVQDTIREFCNGNAKHCVTTPTLITMIGVVDLLADPRKDMGALFDLMARKLWLNVPVLVATFDPDFFLPGLPIRDDVSHTAAHYGVNETLRIRDPAIWEELFVDCGFHLLEQRPLHISGMPPALSTHLHELHEHIFASNASVNVDNPLITKARVPPRQGPFYLWLLCPRNATIDHLVETPVGPSPAPRHVEVFAETEALSVLGNLGTSVYRVIKGRASFESNATGYMDFGEGVFFGQLEASCNYVSSRIFGMLSANKGSKIEVTDSRRVLHYLNHSEFLADKLFLSLLHHLSSVQFTPFVSAKRSDTMRNSAVLRGRSFSLQLVQNVAASLLQASANAVPDALSHSYRSRILVDFGADQIGQFVYGPKANRETDKLLDILPELVQANVIDSFSAHSLEHSGAQEIFDEIDDIHMNGIGPSHVGWQAARYIHHGFMPSDVKGHDEDIGELALAISAFLGSENDRAVFKSHWERLNQIERHNHQQGNGCGRPNTRPMPKTEQQRRDYVVELVQCTEEESEKLRVFLDRLHDGFDYKETSRFAKECALSRFMVIRDIWALLACLLDRQDMWNTNKKKIGPIQYVNQEVQKPRIIAYIQECIVYAGRQSGLDICLY